MTLHEEARTDKLTEQSLKQFLGQDKRKIDEWDKDTGLTPLAIAAMNGHDHLVKLLLDNGAKPNVRSVGGRTPLWITADQTTKNRAIIVDRLLKAGAKDEVDATDNDLDKETPLMRVIRQFKDADVVKLLIDAGADKTSQNFDKETPESIAKQIDNAAIDEAMRPQSERSKFLSELITLVGALILFVLSWATNSIVKGVIQGVVNDIHKATNAQAAVIAKEIPIPRPKTADEFKTGVNDFIKKEKLHKFFKPNDPFLDTLVKNAVQLQNNPNTFFNTPQKLEDLTRLSMYQPVIYCDDSTSMSWDNRMDSQRELVRRITEICTLIVPPDKGVDLCFINADKPSLTNLRKDQVKQILETAEADGSTQIGTNLKKKILQPYVYDKIDKKQKFERPMLISIITDGSPSDESEETLKEVVIECGNKLLNNGYEPRSVMFQISQIGADELSKEFLEKLRNDRRLKDTLHCTADQLDEKYRELRKNEKYLHLWLMKTLASPLATKRG
jgi:hypothetical protein